MGRLGWSKMDIATLGIGGIIGATLVASLNLYIFLSNRKKDEIKERIEKLYSPLYVHYLEYTRVFSHENTQVRGYFNTFPSIPLIAA